MCDSGIVFTVDNLFFLLQDSLPVLCFFPLLFFSSSMLCFQLLLISSIIIGSGHWIQYRFDCGWCVSFWRVVFFYRKWPIVYPSCTCIVVYLDACTPTRVVLDAAPLDSF